MLSKGGEGDIASWTDKDQAAGGGGGAREDQQAWHGLKTVLLERSSPSEDLGFTLRHFVVYPPDTIKAARMAGKHPTVVDPSWDQHKQEAMDTIFVREVQPGSAADRAGLVTGDRIVSINGQPVTGRSYAQIVDLIKRGGLSVQLLVVPKEDDILQLYFASAAYQPVRRPPWQQPSQTSSPRPTADASSLLLPQQRLRGMPSSEPTSPIHCAPSTHFRPVNPARRRFFGLDPSPPPATTASATAASPPQGTTLGSTTALDQGDGASDLLASQPMSLSYPSYRMAEVGAPRPPTSSKMPPSTSVPMHLGTQFLKPEDPWPAPSRQADSGIGSVEDTDPKQAAATSATATQPDSVATDEQSSLNLVAQRLHLFESGGLLARSLERMKLYRSELARLKSGCPVPIVSVRAAKFEEMDGSGSDGGRRGDGASETSSTLSAAPPPTMTFDRLLPLSSPTSRIPSFDRSPDSPIMEEEKGFSSLPDPSTLARSNEGDLDNGAVYQTDGFVSADVASSVVYRRKNGPQEDKAHPARRTSYLRATANERLHLESDHSEDEQHSVSSTSSTPSGSHRIQRLKAFFGDKASNPSTPVGDVKNGAAEEQPLLQQPEVTGDVQGWLACKTVLVDGKRSSDRSWRPVWVVLKGDKVYILKDRKTIDFAEGSRLSVRTSMSDVARDYTKRKHVFRLRMESGTEYLFQADNHSRMMQWVDAFRQITAEDSEVEELMRSDRSVLEKAQAFEQQQQGRLSPSHYPPPPAVARPAPRKLALRHRSPTSGSPRVKSRRASLGDEPSLKAVHMWRGKVVHGWKKFHGSLASLPPKGGHSIGVPLHECPPSTEHPCVPWLVSQCCRLVEAKGLETVGVYRIPGNSAAVAALSAMVNGTGAPLDLTDPRWGDVHVVSSLLKAFFRQLPDPLAGLYPRFIAAARVPQGAQRLAALRALVHELPMHNFETLKFLMQHLKKVVAHSETNKMEARNLAIVFGPTLVRTADNSMLTMITDMSHQCHITEALINYADYVFSPSDEAAVPDLPVDVAALSDTDSSVLLGNLHKVGAQASGSNPEVSTRDLVSSLVSAANRKLRQRKLSLTVDTAPGSGGMVPVPHHKPGSRVKDKIRAFEGKAEEPSCSQRVASNGSLPEESASPPPPPHSAGSSSYPPSPTRTLLGSPPQTPSVCSEDLCSSLASGSASPRTYGQLSALAQQKVRHLEEETRAQLRASSRRCWPPPGACPGGPAQREQIERDWQRAKQELERDDLLDFLADEPAAYLRLLGASQQQQHRLSPVPFSPLAASASGAFFRSPQPSPPQLSQAPPPAMGTEPAGRGEGHRVSNAIDDVQTPGSCCSETFQPFGASEPMESPPSDRASSPPQQQPGLFDSRHEKENIPQTSSGATTGVTYRCKKQCLNGASTRYAIYRVDDEAAAAAQRVPQQRHSENGVVAALVSRLVEGEAVPAVVANSGTRRRPLSSMGLQRRHTIGSSRDVKFHPFPTVRKVPSGQRTEDGGCEWKRAASLRVASPV